MYKIIIQEFDYSGVPCSPTKIHNTPYLGVAFQYVGLARDYVNPNDPGYFDTKVTVEVWEIMPDGSEYKIS